MSPSAKEKKQEVIKLRRYIYSARGVQRLPVQDSVARSSNGFVQPEASSSGRVDTVDRPDSPVFATDVINMIGKKESLAVDQFDGRIMPNKELEDQKLLKAASNRSTIQEKNRAQGGSGQEQKLKEPQVMPIDACEDELPDLLEKYFEKADQNLQKSLIDNTYEIIDECSSGQDPRWFYLIEGDKKTEPIGLAAININNSNFTSRRLQLIYFSTTNVKYYDECLKELIKYLWKQDACNEIWLGMYHTLQPNGNLGVDKAIDEILKTNGLRWKRVTNDANTDKRKTEYAVKRPDDAIADVK